MPEWTPTRLKDDSPPYLALLELLQHDIESGRLKAGVRLPAHRKLAAQLGISISTVTKAYRTAGQMGLIGGRPGQGTFVLTRARSARVTESDGEVNLGFNLAPRLDQRDALRKALGELSRADRLDDLFAHSSIEAQNGLKQEIAAWLVRDGHQPDSEQVVLTNGAQHGIDLALDLLADPGAPVLVEELTYVGFKALAATRRFPLVPVRMDAEGLLPDALDAAIESSGARVLYCMPTLQSPTARNMGPERRMAIAGIARKHDIRIIEDDVYNFLATVDLPTIASFCPERTIYLSSFSKLLGLGFRLGAAVVPPAWLSQAQVALRATAWTTTALLTDIVAGLMREGKLQSLADKMRRESVCRVEMFREIFSDYAEMPAMPPMGYHVWLPLRDGAMAQDLHYRARSHGVLITPPGAAAAPSVNEMGARICLGGDTDRETVRAALVKLREVVDRPKDQFFGFA